MIQEKYFQVEKVTAEELSLLSLFLAKNIHIEECKKTKCFKETNSVILETVIHKNLSAMKLQPFFLF